MASPDQVIDRLLAIRIGDERQGDGRLSEEKLEHAIRARPGVHGAAIASRLSIPESIETRADLERLGGTDWHKEQETLLAMLYDVGGQHGAPILEQIFHDTWPLVAQAEEVLARTGMESRSGIPTEAEKQAAAPLLNGWVGVTQLPYSCIYWAEQLESPDLIDEAFITLGSPYIEKRGIPTAVFEYLMDFADDRADIVPRLQKLRSRLQDSEEPTEQTEIMIDDISQAIAR